jgi:CarD family transcriptional regulator, regulator of rRNA transcription
MRQGEWERNWSLRYKLNLERLASGDLARVTEVVTDLEDRAREVGLTAGEGRQLTRARQLRHILGGG